MRNVLRIYNDEVGVELCQRTGRNPSFQYVQIGCSKRAENAILEFARRAKGKPFSMSAMARSVLWPRTTNHQNYFCAELVAAALQHGGLMDARVNPGSATPESLYRSFSMCGATTGNPCTMRHFAAHHDLNHRHGSRATCSNADMNFAPRTSSTRSTTFGTSNESGTGEERRPLLQGIRSFIGRFGRSPATSTSKARRTTPLIQTHAGDFGARQARHASMDSIELGHGASNIGTTNPALASAAAPSYGARPHSKGSMNSSSVAEQRIRDAVRNAVACGTSHSAYEGASAYAVSMYAPVSSQGRVSRR